MVRDGGDCAGKDVGNESSKRQLCVPQPHLPFQHCMTSKRGSSFLPPVDYIAYKYDINNQQKIHPKGKAGPDVQVSDYK